MEFSWDPKKNKANVRKHGVSFDEATSCFFDPMHILIHDTDHSSDKEERFVLIGVSSFSKLLVVVHAEEISGQIRIISARKSTKKERKQYEEV